MSRDLINKFLTESRNSGVRELNRILTEIAPTDMPVMIIGESGTGKELVALQIHRRSGRENQPFVKVVCSTLTLAGFDHLLPSRDGEKGSLRSVAEPGTLFLDEISDLDQACQRRLLHALPNGDALPPEQRLRGRVISSSRRHLDEEISTGYFREDLYYRLNDVCLSLPPLRQRKEDIPDFVDFFLTKYAAQFARPKPILSVQTLDKLQNYSWPGNIRQLENTVKRIVALRNERLALADLESTASDSVKKGIADANISLKQAARAASQQAERGMILRALERTHWNRKRAAKELQISYKAFLYKLKQMRVDDPAGPSDPAREPVR